MVKQTISYMHGQTEHYCKTSSICLLHLMRFWTLKLLLNFNFAVISIALTKYYSHTINTSKFSRDFIFTYSVHSRNSRKLNACGNFVFHSSLFFEITLIDSWSASEWNSLALKTNVTVISWQYDHIVSVPKTMDPSFVPPRPPPILHERVAGRARWAGLGARGAWPRPSPISPPTIAEDELYEEPRDSFPGIF